ncbi:DUF2190 family protein [Candidatus Saccharibacteria bacterium]|nr:DUF2190 family protein [Candidatus Saccharibacteria bacterium]
MKWPSPKLLSVVVLVLFVGGIAGFASAEGIVRSFNAKTSIEAGQVVAIATTDSSSLELAPAKDPTRIYGVAVQQSTAPVTLQQSGQNIFVATSGVYPVLASTENGAIKTGDYLSMSSEDGIAARVKGQVFVIGQATQNFDGKTGGLRSGKNGSVIGKVPVQLSPGESAALIKDSAVPAPLRKIAEAIAGRPLSASRIYAALAVFIITAGVAFALLWTGVRNGMIAIGRNPLSKHSILQSLVQVITAAAVVFVGGLFGIYLLLRL